MKRPGHTWFLPALIAAAFIPAEAHAWTWLTLYPLDAEAILRFDGTKRTLDNGLNSTDTEWRAGVRIRQEAYTLDPAIARYLVEIEPVWSISKYKFGGVADKQDGNFYNYLITADVLQGTPGPVGFNLALLQTHDLSTGSLGSRYENSIRDSTASIRWKNEAFPMRFMYNSRDLKQDFRSSLNAPASERDEKLDTLTLEGRSSKMDLLIERQILDDRVRSRDNDYEQNLASLNHRLFWGKDSSLRSYVNYFDRIAFNSNRQLRLNEDLQIQHTENVYSQSRYSFQSVKQDFKSIEHTGYFQLNHRLYNNLQTYGEVRGLTRTSDAADVKQWRTGLGANYSKGGLPFGASVSAGARYIYELTDRESKLGLVEVVDEAHVVALGGEAILNRRFILTSTIIVTDADGQLVYSQGSDYEVFELASELTQIQAIPGGRIENGDTILVSYKAQALPSAEFSTTYTTVSLGFSLPWMRFTHYNYKVDNNLRSGAGGSFLTDRQDMVTRLDFNWHMSAIDATMAAERRFYTVNDFESTAYTFTQQFGWAASGRIRMSLNFLQQFTETTNLDTNLYNMNLMINWQPYYNLTVHSTLGAWRREDSWMTDTTSGQRDDTYIFAGVGLIWYYRKVTLTFDLYSNQRTINETDTRENRIWFNLRRRF